MTDTLIFDLARDLLGRASITPKDEGCLDRLVAKLLPLGFECERMDCEGIANLYARRGTTSPLFAFAGHVDVVPTGPLTSWTHPPFLPTLSNGRLYARGAADMKSSIAAFVGAVSAFLCQRPDPNGSIALLITCDEEAEAVHGTAHMVRVLQKRGEQLHYCLVGEPTSEEHLADTVKIGRRGSLSGHLIIKGVQGHVAYPHLARNPVHQGAAALAELAETLWDKGDTSFPPTTFQISNIHAGTGADNIIPGELTVQFNFRYSPASPAALLKEKVKAVLKRHALDYQLTWMPENRTYYCAPAKLYEAISQAVAQVMGSPPKTSTAGGTSDGRFIADICPEVVELGPSNATIHKVDENVVWDDILKLSKIYQGVLQQLL